MAISRKAVLRELRDIVILIFVGLLMATRWYKNPQQFLVLSFFTATMWIFLWKGNALVGELVSRRMDWFKSPLRTFILSFIATIGYTVGIVFILAKSFEAVFSVSFGSLTGMLYGSVIVTLIISLFMHGRAFLLNWRETALEHERLKRESISARYESLKSQVNPHFLFNSLNVLTNLVYENQDLAAKFIKQLSDVYRYVLDTRTREVVSRDEELKFLESYLFLQRIRFGDNLRVTVNLEHVRTAFPPLVLQMLVENAIKHNVITTDKPLVVNITERDGYVEVSNSLQPKIIRTDESTGVGLSNIRQRYHYLVNKEVLVSQTGDLFLVRLPLIPVDDV
jgi:sensor histidine kinase YesM